MQGTIDKAEYNDNGKLRLQIGGQWYTAKPPELANMVGQVITFEPQPWTIPNTNKVINFINDYGVTAGTTPADQAFNQAHAQAPPMGSPVPPGNLSQPAPMSQPVPTQNAPAPQPAVNKDAMISALALVKAVQCNTAQDAWNAFTTLYYKVLEWNPGSFDDDPRF